MSEFADQAVALRRLAERLDDTARRLAGLPAALASAWDEPSGREWADRLELVRRETGRRAADTAQLAETVLAETVPTETVPTETVLTGPDPAGGVPGVRLGGTGGSRTTGSRGGVVAPLLPPYGSTAGPA